MESKIDSDKVLKNHRKRFASRKFDVMSEEIIKNLAKELGLSEVDCRLCIVAYTDFIRKGVSELDRRSFDNFKTYRIPGLGSFQASEKKYKYYLKYLEKNGIELDR